MIEAALWGLLAASSLLLGAAVAVLAPPGVRQLGVERVLYGSDIPFHHPAVEIMRVKVSGLGPEELDRVLRGNSRVLFLGESVGDEEVTGSRAMG